MERRGCGGIEQKRQKQRERTHGHRVVIVEEKGLGGKGREWKGDKW